MAVWDAQISPKEICLRKRGGGKQITRIIVIIPGCTTSQLQVLNAIVNKTFKGNIQSVTLTDYVEETDIHRMNFTKKTVKKND